MAKQTQMVIAHGIVTTREIETPETTANGFKVGDRVRAKRAIIDGDDFICAEAGDIGTVLSIVDEDAMDVDWPEASSVTGDDEVEAVLAA